MSEKSLGDYLTTSQVALVMTVSDDSSVDFKIIRTQDKHENPQVEYRIDLLYALSAGMIVAAREEPEKLFKSGLKLCEGALVK